MKTFTTNFEGYHLELSSTDRGKTYQFTISNENGTTTYNLIHGQDLSFDKKFHSEFFKLYKDFLCYSIWGEENKEA